MIDLARRYSLALLCCLLTAAIALAQSISGRIVCVVSDQTGAVIPNAVVVLTNEATGAVRRATTDDSGVFLAPELPVGLYSLNVEGGGFAPATLTRIKVDVGAETRVSITLKPQATESALDVRA